MAFFATVMNYVDRLAFNYLSAEGPLRELIPDEAFGYIGTAFFIGYMVSNFASGFVIDRLGTRVGYSLCMAFWTTATLLQAVARAPMHFSLVRLLLGVGEAGNWPAAIKLTGEWFSPEERSTAIGIFNSGAAVGAIITPPLVIWLSSMFNWQTVFLVIGAVGYLWLIIFWFVYYTPEHIQKRKQQRNFTVSQLIKSRFVRWFTVSKAFMDPIWYFLTFWIARYLVDVHGWKIAEKGWLIILPFLLADAGNISGGYLTQLLIKRGMPIPKARIFVVSVFGSLLAGCLITAPLIIDSPATALIVLSCASYCHAAYTCNTMAFPGDVVPSNAVASVWGLASVGAGLGGMVFQSLSGITISKLSTAYNYATAYDVVFIAYGISALIALLIICLLAGPLKKDERLFALNDPVANNQ